MRTLTVESANKERNKYLLWLAVSWPLVYLPLMLIPDSYGSLAFAVTTGICAVAFVVMVIALVKLIRLTRDFKRHPEIGRALKGEIFAVYKAKALNLAFFTLIFLILIFTQVSAFYPISSYTLCRILFVVGLETYIISWLIYNK